jgi:MEMO1 family protein
MSLVFAAIVPHPPILIPNIGKEHLGKIEKTKQAIEKIEQDLYSVKPDIILVISPHGEIHPKAFTINLAGEYDADFEHFGDFETKLKFKGDTVLMTFGKEKIAAKSPVNIISEPKLDHGVSIPLYYLAQHLQQASIIPVYFSMLDSQAHFEFGKGLKEVIMDSDKRVAVIASGDLSHCLTEGAPVKCDPAGKQFDDKLIKLVESCDSLGIVNFDHELADKAHECGLRSIQILAGIISDIKCQPEILSYEAPFGVGYLVASINMNY